MIFTLSRPRHPRVPQEALIGVVYVVAAAAGILIPHPDRRGQGRAATVTGRRTARGAARRGPENPWVVRRDRRRALRLPTAVPRDLPGSRSGPAPRPIGRVVGFCVLCAVRLRRHELRAPGGVLLTFSYLIVPAVCATYLAESWRGRLAVGWGVATLASLISLALTPKLDLPSARPSCVCWDPARARGPCRPVSSPESDGDVNPHQPRSPFGVSFGTGRWSSVGVTRAPPAIRWRALMSWRRRISGARSSPPVTRREPCPLSEPVQVPVRGRFVQWARMFAGHGLDGPRIQPTVGLGMAVSEREDAAAPMQARRIVVESIYAVPRHIDHKRGHAQAVRMHVLEDEELSGRNRAQIG